MKRLYFLHLGPQLLSWDTVSLDSVDSCSPLLSTFHPPEGRSMVPHCPVSYSDCEQLGQGCFGYKFSDLTQ